MLVKTMSTFILMTTPLARLYQGTNTGNINSFLKKCLHPSAAQCALI